MSQGKHALRFCLILTTVAVPLVGRAQDSDFVTELNQARDAMRDEPAKGYYEGPFYKAFYGQFSGWLNQCTQQTGRRLPDLDLILSLDSQGKVSTLRIRPQSDQTECFAAHVKKEQFPTPPSGPLRVPVTIRMTEEH